MEEILYVTNWDVKKILYVNNEINYLSLNWWVYQISKPSSQYE